MRSCARTTGSDPTAPQEPAISTSDPELHRLCTYPRVRRIHAGKFSDAVSSIRAGAGRPGIRGYPTATASMSRLARDGRPGDCGTAVMLKGSEFPGRFDKGCTWERKTLPGRASGRLSPMCKAASAPAPARPCAKRLDDRFRVGEGGPLSAHGPRPGSGRRRSVGKDGYSERSPAGARPISPEETVSGHGIRVPGHPSEGRWNVNVHSRRDVLFSPY